MVSSSPRNVADKTLLEHASGALADKVSPFTSAWWVALSDWSELLSFQNPAEVNNIKLLVVWAVSAAVFCIFLFFPISGRRPETYSVVGQRGLNVRCCFAPPSLRNLQAISCQFFSRVFRPSLGPFQQILAASHQLTQIGAFEAKVRDHLDHVPEETTPGRDFRK